nr:hypothetical protein [Desulfobacula sp.]
MNLLLDFLNIKVFSVESLIELFKKNKVMITIDGYERGYERQFYSKLAGFENINFWLEPDFREHYPSEIDIIMPGDKRYEEYFDLLSKLQGEWAIEIEQTKKQGPDINFLNKILKSSKFEELTTGENPWDISKPKPKLEKHLYIEEFLDLDYLQTFLDRNGHLFKQIRVCKNPECSKFFVYNRPDKLHCCEACRLRVSNKKRIEDGKHAAYQRKMRKIAPAKYK